MRIKCFGWRNPQLDQISRIEKGFLDLGHELVDENPDIVYSNNDFYDDILDFANKQENRPFIILNVLDLQLDKGQEWLDKLKGQLLQADQVTCISDFVKKEIKEHLGINAINIGNPIKDISYNPNIEKDIDFTIIGRNSDKNKRGYLFEELLKLPENKNRTFMVVGPEPLPNTKQGWVGVIDDKQLGDIYNRSKFVICGSKNEGLNLVVGESCVGGAIPIIANDMSTCQEWGMPEFSVNPDVESINNKIKEIEQDYSYYRRVVFEKGIIYKEQFSAESVCKRIIDLFNNK